MGGIECSFWDGQTIFRDSIKHDGGNRTESDTNPEQEKTDGTDDPPFPSMTPLRIEKPTPMHVMRIGKKINQMPNTTINLGRPWTACL